MNLFKLKFILLICLLTCSFLESNCQDLTDSTKAYKNNYVLNIIPSRSPNSYGIQIGTIGSEAVCGYPYYKISNGLNIQIIGQGILFAFTPIKNYRNLKITLANPKFDTLNQFYKAVHNGFLFSTFGAAMTNINGICFSLIYGDGQKLNGIGMNLIRNKFNYVNGIEIGVINEAGITKGAQLGLINLSKQLVGIQIGLWNVNQKRKLPLINWSFKKIKPSDIID